MGTKAELADLIAFLRTTGLRPLIDRVLPLEPAADGLAAMAVRRPRRQDRPRSLTLVTAVVCAAFDPATDAAIYSVRDVFAPPASPCRRARRIARTLTLAAARVDPGEELQRRGRPCPHGCGGALATPDRTDRGGPLRPRRSPLARPGAQPRTGRSAARRAPCARVRRLAAGVRRAQRTPRSGCRTAHWRRESPSRFCAVCRPRSGLDTNRSTASVDALATILVGGRGDVGHVALGA